MCWVWGEIREREGRCVEGVGKCWGRCGKVCLGSGERCGKCVGVERGGAVGKCGER